MLECRAQVESVASSLVPGQAFAWLGVDDDFASDGAEGCCCKVEGSIEVLPRRNAGIDGGLAEAVERELGLLEECVPHVSGKIRVHSC